MRELYAIRVSYSKYKMMNYHYNQHVVQIVHFSQNKWQYHR